ncbi:hypothetical protein Ahy_A02g007818 [Arachis hypogaea]|uniref:FAR1 domain-containing protein n=1 Tax=Arachis hypogaea TaxID=3818 RepID=A0A445EDU5_ARAHY|nr:hypothetical protein Ahy_A02g007818 [Arachis hypogaea]
MHHPPPPRRQKHVHGPSSPTARRSSLLFCVLLCSSFRSPSSLLVVQSLRSKVQPSSPDELNLEDDRDDGEANNTSVENANQNETNQDVAPDLSNEERYPDFEDLRLNIMNDSSLECQLNYSEVDFCFESNEVPVLHSIVYASFNMFIPKVGMIFNTFEDATKFYKDYSKAACFSKRIRSTNKKKNEIKN